MKKLLLLGGFPQMIDIVTAAREMGVYTVVVDNNPTSAAKSFADKSFDISTNDVDALLRLCREEGISGVFSGFEDFNIHIAEQLCRRLGLSFYATKEQLEIVTDKPEELSQELIETLHHGVTEVKVVGMYSHTDKYMLVCIINKRQIGEMMSIIKSYPDTFASYEKVSEVFGNFARNV